MLNDDGHLLGILREETTGDTYARGVGGESNEEMMLARQPGACHFGEHLADNTAKRVLRQNVVADKVLSHFSSMPSARNTETGPRRPRKGSGGFCCQVPPNPARK